MPETPMRTTGANIAWLRSFTAERARSMCDPLPTRKYPLTRMKMALPIFPHEAAAEKMKRRSYWIGWQKSPVAHPRDRVGARQLRRGAMHEHVMQDNQKHRDDAQELDVRCPLGRLCQLTPFQYRIVLPLGQQPIL